MFNIQLVSKKHEAPKSGEGRRSPGRGNPPGQAPSHKPQVGNNPYGHQQQGGYASYGQQQGHQQAQQGGYTSYGQQQGYQQPQVGNNSYGHQQQGGYASYGQQQGYQQPQVGNNSYGHQQQGGYTSYGQQQGHQQAQQGGYTSYGQQQGHQQPQVGNNSYGHQQQGGYTSYGQQQTQQGGYNQGGRSPTQGKNKPGPNFYSASTLQPPKQTNPLRRSHETPPSSGVRQRSGSDQPSYNHGYGAPGKSPVLPPKKGPGRGGPTTRGTSSRGAPSSRGSPSSRGTPSGRGAPSKAVGSRSHDGTPSASPSSSASSLKKGQGSISELDSTKESENHYLVITTDPRYQRWLLKLKPKFTQGRFWKNYAADPSHLPVVGIGVTLYRAGKAHELKGRIEKVSSTIKSEEADWDNTLVQMKKTANMNIVKTHTKAGVSLLFSAVPVSTLIPGLGTTAGAAAGSAAGQAAEKGAELGIKQGAKKASAAVAGSQLEGAIEGTAVGEIFSVWEHTQAFLIYLGYPQTSDNLYAKWEKSRIALKSLYGADPKDDLFLMKPDAAMEKKLSQIESKEGATYNMEELGVSLLFLLWRSYSCWRGPYWEMYKDTLRGATMEQVRMEERKEDYIQIQKDNRNDPAVIKIGKHFSDKVEAIIKQIIPQRWPFPDAKDAKDREKKQKWIFKFIMGSAGSEEKWAYVDESSGSFDLLAVALFQPGKHSLLSFKGALAKSSVSGPLTFGVDGYKQVASRFLAEETAIKKAVATLPKEQAEKASVAYLVSGDPKVTSKLLYALANQPFPTIALCYDNETSQMGCCKEAGFRPNCVEYHSEGSGAVHAFVHDMPKWFEEAAMKRS